MYSSACFTKDPTKVLERQCMEEYKMRCRISEKDLTRMQKNSSSEHRNKKAENLLASLKGKLHRASDYFDSKEKEGAPIKIADLLPDTEVISNDAGKVTRRIVKVPFSGGMHKEANYPFPFPRYLDCISSSVLIELARDTAFDVNLNEMVFFDVETTGLAGGTGTYPFLIGLAYVDTTQIVVEQLFMEDYDREAAVVRYLKERLKEFSTLVTYNGKTFDVPLMRTRFIYHREPLSVWKMPNLDLLHLSRRFWKKVFRDCTLGTIEQKVLGIGRERDVDGRLVPRIYFDYVRGIYPERMLLVFDHNAQDVISLVSLLGLMAHYYSAAPEMELSEPHTLIGLARLLEQNGHIDRARECMENALFNCKDTHLSHLIMSQTAKMYKRQKRWKEAVELWTSQIDNPKTHHLEAFIELAKYYEHHAKDHHRARDCVMSAMEFISSQKDLAGYMNEKTIDDSLQTQTDALLHRLTRLKTRIRREENKQPPTHGEK